MPFRQRSYISIYQFLWQAIKPYRWWYALIFQATFVASIYFFANNYAIKLIVDAFSNNQLEYGDLTTPIVIFILAQMAMEISWRLSEFALWHSEPYVHRSILLRSYDQVQYHSYNYFQNNPNGTIISKLKGLLEGYDSIRANLHYKMGKNFVTTFCCIFSLLIINKFVFLFMFSWSIITIAILLPMSKNLNCLSNSEADIKHEIFGRFSDNILNIFSLFYFAQRKEELARIKNAITTQYIPSQIKTIKYFFKLSTIGSMLYCTMLVSVFLFMIWLRKHGLITTGDFVFVMMMAITISSELWLFTNGLFDFMKEIGDFKSSFAVLTDLNRQIDKPSAKDFKIKSPTIAFHDLSFQYDSGKPVFNKLNLVIQAGQKVGIVGHSGAGKSTLISLLLKNFSPITGHILVDNQPIDDIKEDSLRSQIALIPQDILLFHQSIAENIRYAKEEATLTDIKIAAKLANIDEYIESLPDQYNTIVGERGVKLSGGQRQRIAIARAILKQAPIIILDEATSSLDTVTEQQIQQSIYQLLTQTETTLIAIAHRLSTIRHMDRIVVMDKGQIIEDGSFDELISKKHGYFKTLWNNQMNGIL